MAYIPPNRRSKQIIEKESEWTVKKKKPSEYVKEYPSLNNEMESIPRLIKPVKITLSELFKNSLKQKKKKINKIKPGWILLTKNGIIDSLSKGERQKQDEAHFQRIHQMKLDRLFRASEKRDNDRRENDPTYLWEWERMQIDFNYNEESDEEEYYSETESEEDYDSLEQIDE